MMLYFCEDDWEPVEEDDGTEMSVAPYELELKDTINEMLSDDYEDRFWAEYQQLMIRRDKLESILIKYALGTLDFALDCPIELLRKQYMIMNDYLDVLMERANYEEVRL